VTKLDEIRADKLIELARTRYKAELSEAEEKVLRDSASSASSEELLASEKDAAPEPEKDAPRPEISAEFLRWLATDPEAAEQIDPKGIRVYGATIPGELDLQECVIVRALDFQSCEIKGKLDLRSATTRGIFVFNSLLAEGR
jgi:hypothetical protein